MRKFEKKFTFLYLFVRHIVNNPVLSSSADKDFVQSSRKELVAIQTQYRPQHSPNLTLMDTL